MQFCQCKTTKDAQGFEYARPDVLVSSVRGKCLTCGKPTNFVEVVSEGHFCSDECLKTFYDKWEEYYNGCLENGDC